MLRGRTKDALAEGLGHDDNVFLPTKYVPSTLDFLGLEFIK